MDRVCSGSFNNVRERGGGDAVLCMGFLFSFLCSEGVLYKVFSVLLTWVVTGSGVAPPLSFFSSSFFSFFTILYVSYHFSMVHIQVIY